MTKIDDGKKGQGSGRDLRDDPRIDILSRLNEKRADNDVPVGSYSRTVSYDHGIAHGSSSFTSEVTVRAFEARDEFAKFLSETLGPQGALVDKMFDRYVDQFKHELQTKLGQLEQDPYFRYGFLTTDGQQQYIEAILSARKEYLTAFSEVSTEPALTMPAPARQGSLSFTAMPKNLEEVFECFDSYCSTPEASKTLAGKSDSEKFSAFRRARSLMGIIETQETGNLLDEFAASCGLA